MWPRIQGMVFMSLSRSHVAVAVMFMACVATSYFQADPIQARQQSRDEQLIREARARSNAAIALMTRQPWLDCGWTMCTSSDRRVRRLPVANAINSAWHSSLRHARTRSTSANLQRSTCTCHGRWRRSVGTGPPDGPTGRHCRHGGNVHGAVASGRWDVVGPGRTLRTTRCSGSRYCSQRP